MEASKGALKSAFFSCWSFEALFSALTSGSFLTSKQLFADESQMNEWMTLLNNKTPINVKNINTGDLSQHGETPFTEVLWQHFYNVIALR